MAKGKKEVEPVVEEKAVAVREEATAPAEVPNMIDSAWGTGGVTSNDIIIPRILLMQGMSDKVTEGLAAFGEFRESMNNDLLGKFEKGFEIVPFFMKKLFVEYNVTDEKKKKFLRTIPITPTNENLPYKDEERGEDGKVFPVSRDRVLEFFVLLPQEIDVGGAIPYILSFRRSSIKAGKKLATQMYVKNTAAGKTPASVMMTVLALKQQNDEGTFAVADVMTSKPTPDKYVAEAFKWLQLVNSGKAKVHEEAYVSEASGDSVDLGKGPAQF